MVKNILSLFYTFCAFTAFSLFYSQNGYSQTQGLSLHTDFLSLMLPQGFDNNYYHPGSFLGGFQYIFPVSTGFGLSLGVILCCRLFVLKFSYRKNIARFLPLGNGEHNAYILNRPKRCSNLHDA